MTKEVEYFNVTVFGESFTLASDEGAAEMDDLVRKVDFLMRQTADRLKNPDAKKVAILTALKLARDVSFLEASAAKQYECGLGLIKRIERELAPESLG
ncbi:TPA: hypothetical protein DDZ86_03635 [Candidatus Dependentiae bacterium]|nr:MAG: hypothetical protein UW09_C0003G0079 [candidate division TM6 bacterium GW2011_GWF2_43_87]HBL98707.1 hypothetical protein [Candidatus Dependentiae bacterium]